MRHSIKEARQPTLLEGIEIYVMEIRDILGRVAGSPLSAFPPLIQARLLVELSAMKSQAERLLDTVISHTTENDI